MDEDHAVEELAVVAAVEADAEAEQAEETAAAAGMVAAATAEELADHEEEDDDRWTSYETRLTTVEEELASLKASISAPTSESPESFAPTSAEPMGTLTVETAPDREPGDGASPRPRRRRKRLF